MRLEVPVNYEGFRKYLTVEFLQGANYCSLDVDSEHWALIEVDSCRALSAFFSIAAEELAKRKVG